MVAVERGGHERKPLPSRIAGEQHRSNDRSLSPEGHVIELRAKEIPQFLRIELSHVKWIWFLAVAVKGTIRCRDHENAVVGQDATSLRNQLSLLGDVFDHFKAHRQILRTISDLTQVENRTLDELQIRQRILLAGVGY